jgi:hypothetical protein
VPADTWPGDDALAILGLCSNKRLTLHPSALSLRLEQAAATENPDIPLKIGEVRDHSSGGSAKSGIEPRLVIKATGLGIPSVAMQATPKIFLCRVGRVSQSKFMDDIGSDDLADILSGNTRDDAAKDEVVEVRVNTLLIGWLELIAELGGLRHFWSSGVAGIVGSS